MMQFNGRSLNLLKAVEEAREALADQGEPATSAKRWASRMGIEVRFSGGTYVIQLMDIRATATPGPEFALRSWLAKAEAKLAEIEMKASK